MDNDKKFFKCLAIPFEALHIDNRNHEYEFTRSFYIFKTKSGKEIEYPVCSRCGKLHRSDGGFKIKYDLNESSGATEVKLCEECSKVYEDTLNDFFNRLNCVYTDISVEQQKINSGISSKKIYEILD